MAWTSIPSRRLYRRGPDQWAFESELVEGRAEPLERYWDCNVSLLGALKFEIINQAISKFTITRHI